MSDSKKRSLSLSLKLNNDLEELCSALGVNIHSYMINELAKAVQRDSLALSLKKTQGDTMAKLFEMLQEKE